MYRSTTKIEIQNANKYQTQLQIPITIIMMKINLSGYDLTDGACPGKACGAFLVVVAELNPPKIKSPKPGCDVLAAPEVKRGLVLVPSITSAEAEGAREMAIPETVMAG